jgi:addiction module RelE/StbE family toxin
MDYRVIWSPEAIEDVESIAAYISRDSKRYAAAVVGTILDLGHDLKRSPFMGRMVPELEVKSIRERFVYSYRIIYRIEGDTITIAAVVHGKRLLTSIGERIRDE